MAITFLNKVFPFKYNDRFLELFNLNGWKKQYVKLYRKKQTDRLIHFMQQMKGGGIYYEYWNVLLASEMELLRK